MDCDIVLIEFQLWSRYYVHFRTHTLGKGVDSLTMVPLLSFYKFGFGIRLLKKGWSTIK